MYEHFVISSSYVLDEVFLIGFLIDCYTIDLASLIGQGGVYFKTNSYLGTWQSFLRRQLHLCTNTEGSLLIPGWFAIQSESVFLPVNLFSFRLPGFELKGIKENHQ